MNRPLFGASAISGRFNAIGVRNASIAALVSATLIGRYAARHKVVGRVDAPAAPADTAASTYPASTAAMVAQAGSPAAALRRAGVVSTSEVVVARNDTLDAIFRRMAFDKSDLAAIRQLPGIRPSLDFLKPGDAVKVTHTDAGEVRRLSHKVSETRTLEVIKEDSGFTATMIDDPVETRVRTPDGKPLRKAFLRAPVDFTRVSSVFAQNRLHPILNLIRGHMGTDYAAPTGTPIHAAGDGRVTFEGIRGGYGNAIMLLHGNSVSTLYGHLSRFAKNIRLGSHVNQGEVIGYVGMTGLATGPHLHYEYLKDGVHLNPQTVPLPGAEPLRAQAFERFMRVSAPLLGALSTPSSPPAQPSLPVALVTAVAAAAPQPSSDSPSKTSVN